MRKFSILIVDEDKETRDLLSGLLKRKDRTLIRRLAPARRKQ